MVKIITRLYGILYILGIAFLIMISILFKNNVVQQDTDFHSIHLQGHLTVVSERNNHINVHFRLPGYLPDGQMMAFRSVNQNVVVRIEKTNVYRMTNGNNLFGRSTGICWNYVPVSQIDANKYVDIDFENIYPLQAKEKQPELLLGSQHEIIRYLVLRDLPSAFICVLIAFLGGALIGYWVMLRAAMHIEDSTTLHLGFFALILGIYFMNTLDIFVVLSENNLITLYMSYILLNLMSVPLILFVQNLFHVKSRVTWNVLCFLSMGVMLVELLLQVLRIADFRSTVWLTHMVFILIISNVIIMFLRDIKSGKYNTRTKIYATATMFAIAGFAADMLYYYLRNDDSRVYGRIGFFIYIFIFGYLSAKDTVDLVRRGQEAEIYHHMAYTDVLTGIYNRTAYSRFIGLCKKEDLEQSHAYVLDLNNLKFCNDNLGHALGDYYIMRAAQEIQGIFPENAHIYRIGGDEFCVILIGASPEEITEISHKIQKLEIELESNHRIFEGTLSFGEAGYRSGDVDLYEIIRRADLKMYEYKRQHKSKIGSRVD